jgi:amidase
MRELAYASTTVFVDTEGARKRARVAEKALYSGGALGPLHGVPAALKDLFDYRPGWVNTLGGIRAFAQHRSDQYSMFAQRVEESGAIMLGGTNAPTFGFRGTCDNYLFGPTKTPFNLKMNSGGLRFHAKIPPFWSPRAFAPRGEKPACRPGNLPIGALAI